MQYVRHTIVSEDVNGLLELQKNTGRISWESFLNCLKKTILILNI